MPGSTFATPTTCPECGAAGLRAVTDGERTNFLCPSCGCCWHLELGYVSRVDPATCPGCPWRYKCTAARRPYGAEAAGTAVAGVAAKPTQLRPDRTFASWT